MTGSPHSVRGVQRQSHSNAHEFRGAVASAHCESPSGPRREAGCPSSDRVAGSVFEEFRRHDAGHFLAVEAIQRLIQRTRARWIILSYSSGGRATADELNRVLWDHGKVLEVLEVDYKRNVMSSMKWTNEWTRDAEAPNREFLFLVEKR